MNERGGGGEEREKEIVMDGYMLMILMHDISAIPRQDIVLGILPFLEHCSMTH